MKNNKESFFSLGYLFRWDGVVDRGPYLLIGVIGFAIKHNLDRLVAGYYFNKPWGVFNYIIPPDKIFTAFSGNDRSLLLTLLWISIPFIWIGVVLTLRRLRSAGLPLPFVFIFFIPILNLFLFLLLALYPSNAIDPSTPSRPKGILKNCLDQVIPKNKMGNAAIAVGITVLFGGMAALVSVDIFNSYGLTLFVATPFGMGLLASLLYGYHEPRSEKASLAVAVLSTGLLGGLLLAAAFEGVMCLVMAMPLALVLASIGGAIGYQIQKRPVKQSPAALLVLFFFFPLLMGMETIQPMTAPVFEVKSAVDIQAPPEKVWQKVVSFSEIPPPTELMFKLGIAYPIRAEIKGKGPGAVRHCVFSTGPFVEPIQVWDEPRLLKFTVTENPAPMQEWTPYHQIHPPHLEGFLISNGGQFRLTPLPGGGTRLEGTTWYLHHMWPSSYWQVWSDRMIHQIHLRVLNHIKILAEAKS